MTHVQKTFSRRSFLASALGLSSLCATLAPHSKSVVAAENGKALTATPVLPPGAESMEWFASHCTGCQLCVSVCLHQALYTDMSGKNMLQPSLHFSHGYCHEDCITCSQVCPTAAIRPVTLRTKKRLQIGQAVLFPDLCLVQSKGQACTECAKHCAASAIVLSERQGVRMPVIDTEFCTGCGACEFYCPVRPIAAIRVQGNREQIRL